jgi:two-component system, OmpR family, KDP operon response regulator KdpE
LLHTANYRTVEADTAARAQIEARSHKPDLLIVDLGLLDADGLTLIRGVRQWSSVPILVLSARTMEEQKSRHSMRERMTTLPNPSAPPSCWRVRALPSAQCAGARIKHPC